MIGVVFLSLLVMTAGACGLGMMMFLDVAFCGPGGSRRASRAGEFGRAVGRFDGAGFALRVEQAVSRAATRHGGESPAATCDSACHQREIRVTTPEVLAIVHELRSRLPSKQINEIRDVAQRNLSALDGTHHCPLLLSGGFCACAQARPISCRTRCIAGADSEMEARLLAESVGAGATEVFRDCLKATGLDDAQYELNQALVRALNTPNADRRWSHGEHVLESTTPRYA